MTSTSRVIERHNGTLPVIEVRGGRGGVTKDSLVELWLFREVLWAFLVRQLKVRYKQAVVGVGWAVIQPVVSASLFAIFLGRFAHLPSDGIPYWLFTLIGTTGWTAFSHTASSAMDSLVADQAMLRKVYFPREVLPLAAVAASVVDLLIGLVVVIIAAAFFGVRPGITWLAIPIPLLLLVIPGAALGVGLSALNVYYRDVRYVLPFVLQLGLFVTPVVYPLRLVPAGWRTLYAVANPLAAAIDGVRRVIAHHQWPDWGITLGATVWSALLLVLAYLLFKRLERGFSDRV